MNLKNKESPIQQIRRHQIRSDMHTRELHLNHRHGIAGTEADPEVSDGNRVLGPRGGQALPDVRTTPRTASEVELRLRRRV